MEDNKPYQVIVSEDARRMLGIHLRFLALADKDAAKRKKAQIMKAMRSLCVMPQRFPFLENECIIKGKYRKMYIENWYLVLYQIIEDTVVVDYILDCRKNNEWELQ